MQAVPHGVGPQPVVDSLVIVELLLELETQVPFELPESLVQGWRIRQRG
jgi:acyl carrier protein